MKISTIVKKYNEKNREYYRNKQEIIDKVEALQCALEQLVYPFWVNELVAPIARKLIKLIPEATSYEIFGPFGIGARVSIYFYIRKDTKSITFEPLNLGDGKLFVVDYQHPISDYPKNSIGEINGFNYPVVEIPENADTEWLLQYIR